MHNLFEVIEDPFFNIIVLESRNALSREGRERTKEPVAVVATQQTPKKGATDDDETRAHTHTFDISGYLPCQ